MEWFNKIRNSFSNTTNKITSVIADLIYKKHLNQKDLNELENTLLQADLGTKITAQIINEIKNLKFENQLSAEQVKIAIARQISTSFNDLPTTMLINDQTNVILVCGVNGNGKTTTVAKIANYYKQLGKKVVLAACDTFRAAATEQLTYWADLLDIEIIKADKIGADPASVAYKASVYASSTNTDILLIDTAGRLNNNQNLMQELAKIKKVISKQNLNQPAYSLLVLDATTGQNAIKQVQDFKTIIPDINGLIITKIDSTAKGGTLINIAQQFKLPIYFLGTGEKITDLATFDPAQFTYNLLN